MTTPVRRSGRVASRASQTPAPVAATPGALTGTTRRRQRGQADDNVGLPAIPVGDNFSYGSQGRVELEDQVARGSGLFTNHFAAARNNAFSGNNAAHATAPKPPSRAASAAPSNASRRSRRPTVNVNRAISEEREDEQPIHNSVEDTEEDEEDDASAPVAPHSALRSNAVNGYSFTDVEQTFSYVAPDASNYVNLSSRLNPPASPQEIEAARPWFARVLKETIPRLWDEAGPQYRGIIILTVTSPFVFSFLLFLMSLLPASIDIPGTFNNLIHSIEEQAARARNATLYNPAFDPTLHARLDKVESSFKNLQVEWHQLKDILPEQFMVTKNPTTGTWDIPPTFWTAIESKLNSDYSLTPGSMPGAAPAWDAFVHSNQKKINSLISTSVDTAAKSHLDTLSSSGTIISRQMFLTALEEQTLQLRREMATLRTDAARTARSIASSVASSLPSRQTPSKSAPAYLEDITLLTLARNHILARERNFLSPALGAVVDPYLTSPTHVHAQPNLLATLWTWSPWTTVLPPNPPTAALTPWSEAGECWCAAKSDKPGQAQIAALLVGPVDPSALVVEHVPAMSTLDISSAPRELEVWGLPGAAEGIEAKTLDEKERKGECEGPEPEEGKGWLCLGRAGYDLHAQNWVQTFPLDGRGSMVGKVVVRVLGNWGGERTCVYRLRLLGRTVDEVVGEMEG